MKGLLCLMALACSLGAADPGTRQQIKQDKKDLKQIKQAITATSRQKARLDTAEKSQLKLIEKANAMVNISRNDMRVHEHNLSITEEKLAAASRLAQIYMRDNATNRAWLSGELKLIQKNGLMSELRLLLSAREPSELISRYRFLKTLARRSATKVRETKENMVKLDEYSRFHKVKELEYKNMKVAADSVRIRAEADKRRRNSLLNGIRQKKSATVTLLKELEGSAQNLQDKMDELQRAVVEAARVQEEHHHNGSVEIDVNTRSQLGKRHSLPWPVRGRLLTRFGEQMHPKFHTKVFNRGIEIAAPLGSPVVAVAPGKALYAGSFEGYGQMVILDHGHGYFSVYGQNSRLSVLEGADVKRGEIIAEVGDSSTSGRSSLYFEIRSLAKAVDPMLWLSR